MKLKEAEARAEFAEKTVKKLQKEVDRLEGKVEMTSFRSNTIFTGLTSFKQRIFLNKQRIYFFTNIYYCVAAEWSQSTLHRI